MNAMLKKTIRFIPYLYDLLSWIFHLYVSIKEKDLFCRCMKVYSKSKCRLNKSCVGSGNTMFVGENTVLNCVQIRVRGKNNVIRFGDNICFGKNCSFWLEGNNILISIGSNTTFSHSVHFCAQEDGMEIIVGEDCMFANNIIVRTSDSHSIYDIKTNARLNPASSVKIENHVWVAPRSIIMKKADIGDGSIVGSNTMVNRDVPKNVLVVGMPARIVKQDIKWTREKLF